jgi:uncharacterized paraquat-inducible protein A
VPWLAGRVTRSAFRRPISALSVAAAARRWGSIFRQLPSSALLALATAGIVLAFIANTMPFMSIAIKGRFQRASLITGDVGLFEQGLWPLAALVIS